MGNYVTKFVSSRFTEALSLALGVLAVAVLPLCGATQPFNVPDDVALRIRLDDTLTSVDSEVGDPFGATVLDKGDYQNARVYGHVAQIDTSGRIKGHTTMLLRLARRHYRFHHRRSWRIGNYGFSWTSEDHTQLRSGNVDPHHRALTF